MALLLGARDRAGGAALLRWLAMEERRGAEESERVRADRKKKTKAKKQFEPSRFT